MQRNQQIRDLRMIYQRVRGLLDHDKAEIVLALIDEALVQRGAVTEVVRRRQREAADHTYMLSDLECQVLEAKMTAEANQAYKDWLGTPAAQEWAYHYGW